MAIIKIRGIVVKETLYSESSKILKVFNKELGIISVMSKGCRKPKSALKEGSSVLVMGDFDISYKDKGISNLVGVSNIKHFKNIILNYKDIEKKMYAFSILELTEQILTQKTLQKEEVEEIYEIMTSSITKIDELYNPMVIFDIVLLKYLDYLGVMPCLDCCVGCGSKEVLTLSSQTGGFVCSSCHEGEKVINNKGLKLIRMLSCVDISKIKNLDVGDEMIDVHQFIEEYYEMHTGVYVKIKNRLKIVSKTENLL